MKISKNPANPIVPHIPFIKTRPKPEVNRNPHMTFFFKMNIFHFVILGMVIWISSYYFLGNEIFYEPRYAELNATLGENLTYIGDIRNIGSQDVDVRFSAEGIPAEGVNHIAINFDPSNTQIERGATKVIHIYINTTSALPGDQKGFIYIWDNKNKNSNGIQDVLEKIPITIRVINSSKMSK